MGDACPCTCYAARAALAEELLRELEFSAGDDNYEYCHLCGAHGPWYKNGAVSEPAEPHKNGRDGRPCHLGALLKELDK